MECHEIVFKRNVNEKYAEVITKVYLQEIGIVDKSLVTVVMPALTYNIKIGELADF